MNLIVNQVNNNNVSLTTSVRMLEFKKNKLKRELGNREEIQLDKHFDSPSVWLTLAAMSHYLKESDQSSTFSVDEAIKANSSLIQTKFEILKKAVLLKASKWGVEQELDTLRKENWSQQKEINDL